MRELMCHPKQHILVKLVHKKCIFRDNLLSGCLACSSIDLSQVTMKHVVRDVFSSDNDENESVEVC